MNTKRITLAGLLLAVMCVLGCFSIPLGENIKVSLQLLVVFIIFGLVDHLLDKILIVGCYLLLGLFVPIYAGFMHGVTPTFGFVIGFVLAAAPFHFINKINFKYKFISFILACFVATLVVYASGSIFLALYLKLDYVKSLVISVVPYIPFDIAKIAIAYFAVRLLNPVINKGVKKEEN